MKKNDLLIKVVINKILNIMNQNTVPIIQLKTKIKKSNGTA